MYKTGEKTNKSSLEENMIVYKKYLKKSSKTLNLTYIIRKASEHKVSIQNSIVFQCTDNKNAEK